MDDKVLLAAEERSLRNPYKEYFTTKRRNYLNVVRDLPELWDCYLRLDEIWARDLDNMRVVVEKERPPLVALFRQSHQQFRIAFELGFSTAVTEAFSIMRGSIDSAMVAYKIFREPNALAIWLHKNDDKKKLKEFRDTFNTGNLFPSRLGLSELKSFYSDYSDWGTHPGVGAISLHTTIAATTYGQDWNHTYLETNGKRAVAFLYRMLEAAAMVENVCFTCFEDRLKLDSSLAGLRVDLQNRKQHTAHLITTQIPPAN